MQDGNASGDDLESRLSEFEFALIVAMNGFAAWVSHCADAAGAKGLSAVDMLVLHAINLRARDRKLADICLVLNIEDSHIVAYALKKLVDYGYAEILRNGRERIYRPTPEGDRLCARYLEMRRRALVEMLAEDSLDAGDLDVPTAMLRRLARGYGQASRTATVLARAPVSPGPDSAGR